MTKEALDEAQKNSSNILIGLKSKRKTIGYLQLGSQIIIAICGASFLTELAVGDKIIANSLGVATLISALLTIFMQQLKISFNGEGGIEAMIEKFSGYKYEAKEQLNSIFIESLDNTGIFDEQYKDLISRANLLAFKILQECDRL